jgi:hypothetical protein
MRGRPLHGVPFIDDLLCPDPDETASIPHALPHLIACHVQALAKGGGHRPNGTGAGHLPLGGTGNARDEEDHVPRHRRWAAGLVACPPAGGHVSGRRTQRLHQDCDTSSRRCGAYPRPCGGLHDEWREYLRRMRAGGRFYGDPHGGDGMRIGICQCRCAKVRGRESAGRWRARRRRADREMGGKERVDGR